MRRTITIAEIVPKLSELGEAALEYAANGWEVFPCVPRGKAPLTEHGFKDATTDQEQIRRWWSRFPSANIGYRPKDNEVIFDIDPRNGGTVPDYLPPTLVNLTGGGGYHYYYTYSEVPEGCAIHFRRTLGSGIDIKTREGYLLLPPSITSGPYTQKNPALSIQSLPLSLLDLIVKPKIDETLYVHEYDPLDDRPGTQFNRNTTWKELLEPDGWRKVGDGPEGEEFWCRPGKSSGISATTNYANTDLLYVFTSSTALESQVGYTKFRYYTETQHNGNFSAAAQTITHGGTFQVPTPSVPQHILIVKPDTKEEEEGYKFEPAFSDDHLVSLFLNYVKLQTDAPEDYAEAAALVLISIVGYRAKSSLAPYPGGLANNLYVCLVGPTTVSRKSTVQRIASNTVKAVMPPAVLPNRATTEALIKSLAAHSGLPTVWCPDEFGVTLAQIYSRDYMQGLEEMLLTVYSGDDYEYQKVLESEYIRSPHLSILAAATPESLARAGSTALDSGLLPRFAVVYPRVMPESRAVSAAPDLTVMRQAIVSKLTNVLTLTNTARSITFEPEALAVLNDAEHRISNHPSAARLPTMLYKVSALSALGRGALSVTGRDAGSAIKVVERWVDGVDALIPQMYKHGTDQQFEQQLEYALKELEKTSAKIILRSDIANTLNVKKQRLDEIEATLVDKGKIKVFPTTGGRQWHML